MIQALKNFSSESLFNATSTLMSKLNIEIDRETAEAINVTDLYDGVIPQYFSDALQSIEHTYFIGIINDQSLKGTKTEESSKDTLQHADKYSGMFVFACDARPGFNLTRTTSSALTRAFNRISKANPVILIIRQQNLLSLATCERMDYSQTWRNGNGEKLGKVTILRNINCDKPHRGHVDILNSLGNKKFTTFEELYKYWMEIFSNELLTKKFYNELSDWYAWAVQIAKFPNDLQTEEDDAKYNHESCIRLITRLIFVWFLKQKHLIPEEFFDEKYIKENLIEGFDPHNKKTLLYDSEESKYYRLILQNLFFATLNCPITEEGKDIPNNRKFRKPINGSRNSDYNINNLMRYEKEFLNGGSEKFLKLANKVPFLNGGLFHCLDDKPRKLYYDGFSEKKESLEQLRLPDYLFFGNEVGTNIDLSTWYDDKKKKNVSASGIIDILNHYSFTIEENTPYDQEVSLDPELLGKVFENLLASYNPETKQSARKQTGSFYTPREIVQYMVDESLVAHLKRMCGDEMEQQYRQLLNYSTDDIDLSSEQRKKIMSAIYNCRVFDPACGSGAFPMGILQQMVHILKQLDPTNKMWEELVKEKSVNEIKEAFEDNLKNRAATPEEKEKHGKELEDRTKDIESAFNQSINDPDYARKLYLIENCIYGVDIQPIATQISKLRFFISLVVDQNPTNDAKTNFGIRPLPNLEAKFVTGNTLIPLDKTKNLFYDNTILEYEKKLQEINHRIFLAKRNKDKETLRKQMEETRQALAQAMYNQGTLGPNGFDQLINWDMFDQNSSANFFDPEWMFGIKDGFDIVIGNPPYVQIKKLKLKDIYKRIDYKTYNSTGDLYCLFYELATNQLTKNGIASFITSNKWLKSNYGESLRNFLYKNSSPYIIIDLGPGVFENAAVDTNIMIWKKNEYDGKTKIAILRDAISIGYLNWNIIKLKSNDIWNIDSVQFLPIKKKIEKFKDRLDTLGYELDYGILTGANKTYILNAGQANRLKMLDSKNEEIIKPILRGQDLERYCATFNNIYLLCAHNGVKKENIAPIDIENDYPSLLPYFESFGDKFKNRGEQGDKYYNLRNCAYILKYEKPKIIYADIVQDQGKFFYDEDGFYTNDTAFLITGPKLKYMVGLLNSKAFSFFYKQFYCGSSLGKSGLRFKRDFLLRVPIAIGSSSEIEFIESTVEKIYFIKKHNKAADTFKLEKGIDIAVYHIYDLSYDEVFIIDPETSITREEYEKFKHD